MPALRPFDGFELEPLTESHIRLLGRWHADPQVYVWWEGRPLSEAEIRAQYLDRDDGAEPCLVRFEGRPVGFLQFFPIVGDWRRAVGLPDGEEAWGLDLFLAEEADRGRGLGTRLVRGVLARLAQERGASLVLIDPLIDNPRAIACYRRAGFQEAGPLPHHEEHGRVAKDALLMAWRPAHTETPAAVTFRPVSSERTTSRHRLDLFRRIARWLILGSLLINALLGIWAVAGSLGELGSRALFTSLLVMAMGAVAVAASTAIPEGRLGPAPLAGIAAAVIGFCLLIASLWKDFRPAALWQAGATLVIIAAGVAFAALLSGVNLQGRYRRLLPTAYALATTAGVFLIAVVWGYRPGEAWRMFGVVAVLLIAATLAAPIAAHLRPTREAPPPVSHCPYCGGPVAESRWRVTACPACGRSFRVLGR